MAGERSPGEFFSAAWRSLPRSNHTTRVKTGSDMDLYEHRRRPFALGTLPWPCTVQANRYPTAPQQLLPGNFLQPRSQDLRTLWPHDVVLPAHARTTCVDSTTHEDVKGRTPPPRPFSFRAEVTRKRPPGKGVTVSRQSAVSTPAGPRQGRISTSIRPRSDPVSPKNRSCRANRWWPRPHPAPAPHRSRTRSARNG